jgi:AraC-like DNA-binding protein
MGPLGIAMRNSPTLAEAFRYSAEHVQAYSTATQISVERNRAERSVFLRFEIVLARLPYQRQAVEQALLWTQHNVLNLTNGQVRAREIWFSHAPLSPLPTYRTYFGSTVRFERSMNGLLFAEGDLDAPIPGGDPQIYDLATSFIDRHFPSAEPLLSVRVRSTVERLLLGTSCTFADVASALGMHPRTLQRRLRTEGECFEAIKDGVRRDMALRFLTQTTLPLVRVAEILGYSETSVLSRNCHRWFSASPRQLRGGRAYRAAGGGQARRLEH